MDTADIGTTEDVLLTTWSTYQAAWANIPDDKRQQMLNESVTQECIYTDPASVSYGHRELTAKMQATQRNFPGATFRNDHFASHHGQAVSHWTMFDGNGAAIFTGTSYARYDGDGRLTQMTGFFEPVR